MIKRIGLLAFLALLFAAPSYGAITVVNNFVCSGGINGTTSVAVNSTGANAAAAIVIYSTGSTITAVNSSIGGAMTGRTLQAGTFVTVREYDIKNITGAAGHTFTVSGTNIFAQICPITMQSTDTSTLFDQENGWTNVLGNNIHATGNVTPGSAGEILIAGIGFSGSVSAVTCNNGFSTAVFSNYSPGAYYGGAACYKIQTSIVAEGTTFDWTNDVENNGVISSLKASAPAVSPAAIYLLVQ